MRRKESSAGGYTSANSGRARWPVSGVAIACGAGSQRTLSATAELKTERDEARRGEGEGERGERGEGEEGEEGEGGEGGGP